MSKHANVFSISSCLRRAFLSWLLAVTVEYLLLPVSLRSLDELDGLRQMSLIRVIGLTCAAFLLLWVLSFFFPAKKLERWGFPVIFGILGTTALLASCTWSFFVLFLMIITGLTIFGLFGWDHDSKLPVPVAVSPQDKSYRQKRIAKPTRSSRIPLWITVTLAALFFLFVTAWTVGRIYSFHCPTYDFGIFSQMFYHLKESGMPMTTLERDGLLSHFAVHVSPIFYLLLPFYKLFPVPATLQVLQAAVLTSAVIPLWKLGKHHGLSPTSRMFLGGLLFLYPAYAGGTSYDIHENCFLTPLILWLFYGLDSRHPLIALTAGVLTMMVKEDAAVYVAVIGLWLILKTLLQHKTQHSRDPASETTPCANTFYDQTSAWDLFFGLLLLAISFVWFLCVTRYLSQTGDGVMTYRYKNFLYDGSSSLFTVVKATFLHPMKVLYECVDAEKLSFIGLTLFPLLGLPLLTRRYERYLLLIPYLLVNLMSDYTYQHSIFFQYTFGSTAFLLYLTTVNLADFSKERQRTISLAAALISSLFCFGFVVVPKAVPHPVEAIRQHGTYQEIREVLEGIPEDASVTATTFFTTWLSQRNIVYDVDYCSQEHLLSSEYVILDLSGRNTYKKYATAGKANGLENLTRLLQAHGYTPCQTLDQYLVIYHRNS